MASEYLKWKYRDVKPEEKRELTPAEKWANWWDYHKWHLALGLILLLALGSIAWHVLGMGEADPDVQIAYVGADPLPSDTVTALSAAIGELSEDCDGDGKTTVQINQYVTGAHADEEDGLYYAYASSTKLMADITACDSYLFLLEDPEAFQRNYQVLRPLAGEAAREGAAWEECALAWTHCPVLAGLDLGTYKETLLDREVSGDSQERLAGLYIARRGFWTDRTAAFPEACDGLWDRLTEGALS